MKEFPITFWLSMDSNGLHGHFPSNPFAPESVA